MRDDNSSCNYQQKASRRRVLSLSAGAFAAGLAGCTGRDSTSPEDTPTDTQTPIDTPVSTAPSSIAHEFKSPPYENVETEENGSATTVSGEIVLEEGQYAQREFQFEDPTQIQITGVNEGEGTMDLFLLTPEREFEKYSEGESAIVSGGFAETNISSVERTVEVSPARYFLVFDNTAVYGAEPQGTIRFEFEVTFPASSSTLTEPPTETETESPTETETESPTETETESPTETETETPSGENNAKIVSESDMPKIRKVTDNFGHTFVWVPDEDHSNATAATLVEDEIVVSDETTVTLTIEEIWANPDDDISFSYVFGSRQSSHPDNTAFNERVRSNTHTWDMRREDYATEWRFSVIIRNEDDIYYQNEASQSDFQLSVFYKNLTLE